jgi:subtilisin family serine protease
MKKYISSVILIVSLILLATNLNKAFATEENYIVVFDRSVDEISKKAIIEDHGGLIVRNLDIINAKLARLQRDKINEIEKKVGVIRIDIDGYIQLNTSTITSSVIQSPQIVPWGIERIEAENIGKIVTKDVRVAIMDTGVDLEHPDLKDSIAGGIDITDPLLSPIDIDGHGTHVAGIVSAFDNDIGILGVAPKARLYPVKVFRRGSLQPEDRKSEIIVAYYSDIITGLEWCIDNNIQVVNMSFGSSVDCPSIYDAIIKVRSSGILLVASAGDNNSSDPIYPAAYPEVISVSAIDNRDNKTNKSNYGYSIDLTAPGLDILSTFPNGRYAILSGTDMATPHVTGVLALALAAEIKPDDAERIMYDKAEDLGSKGRDDLYGYGLVDAKRTVYSAWWIPPLIVTAKAQPSNGIAPLTVNFSAEITGGPPTKPVFYKWDFNSDNVDDYSNTVSAETIWTYKNGGTYIATIRVTDFLGKIAKGMVRIDIKDQPVS